MFLPHRVEKKCMHDIISIPFTGKMIEYDLENLALTVVRMDLNNFDNVSAPQVIAITI